MQSGFCSLGSRVLGGGKGGAVAPPFLSVGPGLKPGWMMDLDAGVKTPASLRYEDVGMLQS